MDTEESTPEEHVVALLVGRECIEGNGLVAWRENAWVFVKRVEEPYQATVLIS